MASPKAAYQDEYISLLSAAKRVTEAFRALGDSTPWTRSEANARLECEEAMTALDDVVRVARETS